MAVGNLNSEADLEQFVKKVLDNLGLGQPDSGVADKSVAKAKLAADVLSAFLKTLGIDLSIKVGSATLVFTASATATVSVNHGLGVTPIAAVGYPLDANASIISTVQAAPNNTAIAFAARQFQNTAITANVTLFWIVIG